MYQYVELHSVDNDHCSMPETLVAYPETGEPVVLVGMKPSDIAGLSDDEVQSLLANANTKPWNPVGRCCGSFQRDVWTRAI